MPPVDPTTWLTPLIAYGPLGVMASVLLYFVMKYGPRMIEAHMGFVETCKTTQTKIASSLESLSETAAASEANHHKTHDGLKHLARAGEVIADKAKEKFGSDPFHHIQRAREALGDDK